MKSRLLYGACAAAALVWSFGLQPAESAQDANRDAAVTISQARDIVDRLARRSGEFKEEFDKAVGHSLINGSPLEDRAIAPCGRPPRVCQEAAGRFQR